MMTGRVKREALIFGAIFTGFIVFALLEILYAATLGSFMFLTGIPTPGGAPLRIHVLNMCIKGAWAALAYGLVLRIAFGRVAWRRVAILWVVGVSVAGVLGGLAMHGALAVSTASNVGLLAYLLVGQAVARDWAAQPREERA